MFSVILLILGGPVLPQFQLEIPQFLTPVRSDVICEEMTEENFTPFCIHSKEVQDKFVFDSHFGDEPVEDRFADDD